jgi:hypothetical protein
MDHFGEFMRSSAHLSKEYLLKQDKTEVEKEFLTYFTVLALEVATVDAKQYENLENLNNVPMMEKIDKFMESARRLGESLLSKDNVTKEEASFVTAFTLMALESFNK